MNGHCYKLGFRGFMLGKGDYRGGRDPPMDNGVADVQTRLQELHKQTKGPDKERNSMVLAKAWNASSSANEVTKQKLQNSKVYMVERGPSLIDGGVSSQIESSNFYGRLQSLYKHTEQGDVQRAYVGLAKELNSMKIQNRQGAVIIEGEHRMGERGEAPQILTIQNDTVKKVLVKKGPQVPQILNV